MGSSEDALGCAEVRANRAHVTNRDPNVFSISEPWSMMGGCPPYKDKKFSTLLAVSGSSIDSEDQSDDF